MRWVLSIVVCVSAAVAFAADRTPAPLPPEQAVKNMVVPEGFKVTLVASEPDVIQPVSYCFDDRGRLFVAEALNYGEWQATGSDRIIILEDKDGDGRAETRKVFFEGLNYVTGIEFGFGGVWVMSVPNLYFIPDRNGDDVPDSEPEVMFDGFGYKESRHNLANGFTWGPDGWLYFGHGRTSPSDVGRPDTPREQRIHCDGGVCRIHPTRLEFENFADGTTNPWGVDFDDYGQCFVSNCVNPHLFHVIQGAHYEPWRNRPSSLYAYERIATIADHLHYPSDQPKAMRGETQETLAMGGGHAHCGTLIYLGGTFPERYRNSVFMCNVHGRRINNDILKRSGPSYVASHGPDFMISGDPWFMGVTLKTGPDGSVYVSDWSDTGECHTYKPDRRSGRIYKISYDGPLAAASELKLNLPDVLKNAEGSPQTSLSELSDVDLAKLQLHPNDWYVRHSRRLLQERSSEKQLDRDATHKLLNEMLARKDLSVDRRLRAFWALYVTQAFRRVDLLEYLNDHHEHIRAWTIQLLDTPLTTGAEPEFIGRNRFRRPEEKVPKLPNAEHFVRLARDEKSPLVRLYLAAALQRMEVSGRYRWELAKALLDTTTKADDQNLQLMLWYGIEPLVETNYERFLKLTAGSYLAKIREFGARRFVEHALSQSKVLPLDPVRDRLSDTDDTTRRDILRGMREALRGRKKVTGPTNWSLAYTKLKRSDNPEVRELALSIAVQFGDQEAISDLRLIVMSTTATAKERSAALDSLVGLAQPDLPPLLHGLLEDKNLRRAAIRGLASAPHAETPGKLIALYGEFNPEEKQDAVSTLTSRKEFAFVLLDAIEKKVVPRADVSAYAARQLHALGDSKLSERLRQVWGDVRDSTPDKQQLIAKYKSQLTANALKNADLSNGRLLYKKSCQQCHKLFGEGNSIGPDLTGSNRANLDYILGNVIDPSAEISRDFRMSIVVTNEGRVLTGTQVETTPTRITLQTATERVVLDRADIEEIKESPLSMMPEGQLTPLSKDDVRDLIGYLATTKQVPLPAGSE